MLPGGARIRRPHTPGSNLPAPVLKRHSCVSRALSRIPIEQLPLFFFKAKPATARALLFSCPSLRVCSDAPGQFVAQSAQYFPFLPASDLRCPTSGRTKGRFSKKPRDNSEKRGAIGENTEAFSRLLRSFSPFPTQTRGVSPVILNLCEEGKHRVPILCINFAAFSPFRPRANYRRAHFVYILTAFTFHSTTKHIHRAYYHNYLKIHNPKYPHVVIVRARYCI